MCLEYVPVDTKARGDFFSQQTNIILELPKFARHMKEYSEIDCRNGVLHVLTDEIAFVSPLDFTADFDGMPFSDHFFLLAS